MAVQQPSREQLARQAVETFIDHRQFCSRLKIVDKQGHWRVPDWTPAWARMAELVDRQWRAGKPIRILDLKSRQAHHSAGWCTHIFKRVAFMPGQHARIFCDLHKNAQNLQRYVTSYANSYSPGDVGVVPIGKVSESLSEHRLVWPADSWIEFDSAESAKGGRSASVRHLVMDEFAFWRDAERLMTGALNSVPDDPDTFIAINSTANGQGGPFWERWKEYSDPGYKGLWNACFFSWFEHPANSLEDSRISVYLPVRSVVEFQESLSTEEITLQRQHNLSIGQLAWRRWIIADKCEGSVEKFHQEHPSIAEEAFLTSGRPRFCHISLGRMIRRDDPATGHLERVKVGTREQIQFIPHADGKGEVRIFKRPTLGQKYVMGLDPAEGVLINESRKDPDTSVAVVLEQNTGEQVACIHVREVEVVPFTDMAVTLAEWFNWAFLVPLVNGMGLALMQELVHHQYPNYLIYHRGRDPDNLRPPLMEELGFRENENTRNMLVSTHDRMIRQLAINICCDECMSQHYTFVIQPNGRAEHQESCKDDAVLAGAAASTGLLVAPRIRAMFEQKPRSPYGPDIDPDEQQPVVRGRRYR